jgi:hypothetical protein
MPFQQKIKPYSCFLETQPPGESLIGNLPHGGSESVLVVLVAVGPLVLGQEMQEPLSGVEPTNDAEYMIVAAAVAPRCTPRVSAAGDVAQSKLL